MGSETADTGAKEFAPGQVWLSSLVRGDAVLYRIVGRRENQTCDWIADVLWSERKTTHAQMQLDADSERARRSRLVFDPPTSTPPATPGDAAPTCIDCGHDAHADICSVTCQCSYGVLLRRGSSGTAVGAGTAGRVDPLSSAGVADPLSSAARAPSLEVAPTPGPPGCQQWWCGGRTNNGRIFLCSKCAATPPQGETP